MNDDVCPMCFQPLHVPDPAELAALELMSQRIVERLLETITGTVYTSNNVAGQVWVDEPWDEDCT